MTYNEAISILGAQERKLSKIKDVRFTHDGYEYRVRYEGGFAAFVSVDRRQIGKRNFKYFTGFGAYDCWTVSQVLDRVKSEVISKAGA